MLSYTAAALLATSVFAAHELPFGSGIPLSYAEGGADWPDNCPNKGVQSPIDIMEKTIDREMKVTVEGLENWGLGYAPVTPHEEARAALEPDFSWEMHLTTGAHDAELAEWAT